MILKSVALGTENCKRQRGIPVRNNLNTKKQSKLASEAFRFFAAKCSDRELLAGKRINGNYQENNYFFSIVLGRIEQVAPQERQLLRPSSSFYCFASIFFPAGVRSQFQRVKLSLKKY